MVQLTHAIDQTARAGFGRRAGNDRRAHDCPPAARQSADARHSAAAGRFPARRLYRPLGGFREELAEAAVRLEVAPDHDRVVGLERLGDSIDERPRKPQRIPDFPHRRSGPIRDQVADHAGVFGTVAPVHVLDDFLSTFRREVDVDVGIARSTLVDETFE
jgi:hypothetical protein